MNARDVRHVRDVVEVTEDCEVGDAGELAVVTEVYESRYMTLVFPGRRPGDRVVHTGADYRFLRKV